MALTRKQKQALADDVIFVMANLLDSISDARTAQLQDGEEDNPEWTKFGVRECSLYDVQEQLAKWAKRLPGDGWDYRLGKP